MAWLLIIALVLVTLLALIVILALAGLLSACQEQEAERVEVEVRRAERHIHNVARDAFRSMLESAREHDPRAVQ